MFFFFFFFFFSFIARNFSTLFISIFQVRDDGANGTHGFAMVLSVIDLNEDPSDLSWFSQGLHLPWFRLFTWLYCVATNFVTSQPLNLLSSYPLILSTSQPPYLPTSQPPNLSTSQPLNLSSYVYCTWLYCVATNSLFFFQSFKYTEMGATLSLNSSWLLFDRTSCDNTTEKIKRHGRAHLIHQHEIDEQLTCSFFFFHCSKFFDFDSLDLSSSRWRGQWYPWIRHGPFCDRP